MTQNNRLPGRKSPVLLAKTGAKIHIFSNNWKISAQNLRESHCIHVLMLLQTHWETFPNIS